MVLRKRKAGPFVRKPLECTETKDEAEPLADDASYTDFSRTMTLWDLLVIGVGGTVGSGVFIVSGLIVADFAGAASIISWTLAGIGCLFSAVSYTELSGHVPVEGGAYAYAYHTMGELPAVVSAWLLTLEYGLSGSAVARSCGTRLLHFLSGDSTSGLHLIPTELSYLEYIFSAVLMAICVAITAIGMDVSKKIASVFTIAKLLVIAFMVAMAYALWNADNLKPFAPYGVKGILSGASASFFSYIGFDEPCMFAGEVKNPKRDIPIAMLGTVVITTVIYIISVFALSGLLPYDQLNPDGAFASAFSDLGYHWAGNLVAIGEIVTLPLVVLIAFLPQPRLLYIMSVDELFPKSIGGGIVRASISIGIVCVAVAAFVPFHLLDATESAGILLGQLSINKRSAVANVALLCGLLVILKLHEWKGFFWIGCTMLVVPIIIMLSFSRCCTLVPLDPEGNRFFVIPSWLLPWAPAIGTVFNSLLVAQLDFIGLCILLGIILLAVAHYYLYAHRNSVLGFQSIHGVGGSLELATTAKGEPPAHWKQLETLSSSES